MCGSAKITKVRTKCDDFHEIGEPFSIFWYLVVNKYSLRASSKAASERAHTISWRCSLEKNGSKADVRQRRNNQGQKSGDFHEIGGIFFVSFSRLLIMNEESFRA